MHSTIRLWRSLRPLNNSNTLNTATQHVRQVSNASIFSALNKLSVKEDPNANHNGPVNITKARPNPNVFLNNLPHDIRAEDLKKYLPGSVTKIQLPRVQNEEVGTWSTKFAFVTFESTEAAQAAMQDHAAEPIVISRRAVRMTFVYERDNAKKPVHPRRLFVAGLPLKATRKEVARAFGLKEENVETIQHQNNSGSAILHFHSRDDASKVFEQAQRHPVVLDGLELYVTRAWRPPPPSRRLRVYDYRGDVSLIKPLLKRYGADIISVERVRQGRSDRVFILCKDVHVAYGVKLRLNGIKKANGQVLNIDFARQAKVHEQQPRDVNSILRYRDRRNTALEPSSMPLSTPLPVLSSALKERGMTTLVQRQSSGRPAPEDHDHKHDLSSESVSPLEEDWASQQLQDRSLKQQMLELRRRLSSLERNT